MERNLASLLVLDFPDFNGGIIFQKLAMMSHLTDQILRQVYKLTQDQINVLKNSRLRSQFQQDLNDLKQTQFYQTRITALRKMLQPHQSFLESLKQHAINSPFNKVEVPKFQNIDELLNQLASSIASYPYRVKNQDKRLSDKSDPQRRSQVDSHYQNFLKEMQANDDLESDQASQVSNYELPLKRLSNPKKGRNDSPTSSQARDDLASKRRLQLRDYFPSMKPTGLTKRKRQDRSADSGRADRRPKPKQNVVPRLKRNEEYSSRVVNPRESKSAKGQWGKIIDYFSQETSSTQISGQRHGLSETRSQGFIIGGKNLLNTSQQAPSLDSLFYKKQAGSAILNSAQTALKESTFKKRIFGQFPCEDQDLTKRLLAFDLQMTLTRFKQDKPFKSHLQHQIVKIQTLMGKTQISCSPGESEFYFDGQKYQLNELASIVKSFRGYRETLQQFSLYASNNKIEQINIQFNVFWFLITNALQNLNDSQIRQEITTKVKEEFTYLTNQLNIVDFMSIKSFEYQCSILLHIIMIVNLVQQEQVAVVFLKDEDEIQKILLYMIQWVVMTLITLTFSSQQGIDNARNLIKKELSDSLVLIHLLQKAFGNDTILWNNLVSQTLRIIFKESQNHSNHLSTGQNNKQRLLFSEWKIKQSSFISIESKSSLISLDLTLFSYSMLLLGINYNAFLSTDLSPPSVLDWSLLSDLLQAHLHQSLSSQDGLGPLSPISLKLLSNLMTLNNSQNNASQLSHEHFLVIYKNYLRVVSPQKSKKGMQVTLKQQRETLSQLRDTLLKKYCLPAGNESDKENREQCLLQSYLRTQDQRQVKQLYQKVASMPEAQADPKVLFEILMTFVGAIESDRQALMVMKKAMGIAQGETKKEDWFEISKMIISLAGMSYKFKGHVGEELIDKSEIISCILGLLKQMLNSFIQKVLKNKGNLNQNEYMIKTETYLMQLSSILKSLADFAQSLKGFWKQHEYRWLQDTQQVTDDIFSLYSYLAVKSPDLEALHFDYLRLLKAFLSKRRSSQPSTQGKQQSPLEQSNLESVSMSSSLEGTDDLIAECLIYEEQDQLLVKEALLKSNFRNTIDRVLKGYMTAGKDIRVLVKIFEVSGLIDGLLIEHGEIKPIQVLHKVQANKYGLVNESIDNQQKPMITSLCINVYILKLVSRAGFAKICGVEALQICKNDPIQKDLIIQISYNLLENLIRGLLIYQRPASGSQTVPQVFNNLLKLYKLLRAFLQSDQIQRNSVLIFKDQLNENAVLKAFTKESVDEFDTKSNFQTYEKIVSIFSGYFKEVTKIYQSTEINKQTIMNTVNMYVSLIPILCKQFQEYQSQNKGEYRPYLNFLKSILISYMVTFQHLQQNHPNLGQFISQIINLVMPSFFQQKQTISSAQQIETLENQDAFYFFQYLSLQYQSTPDDPRLASNMRHFLDLCLRTIEGNLNTLIPNLFLQGNSIEGVKTYIRNECHVLKNLMDSIAEQYSSSGSQDQFLETLLGHGTHYLQTSVVTLQWTPQDHQHILKSQRRVLSLLILSLFLHLRLYPHSSVPQRFFTSTLCRTTLYEWASNVASQTGIVEDNLNALAMLRAAQLIKTTQDMTRFACLTMEEIVMRERRGEGLSGGLNEIRSEMMRDRVKNRMVRGGGGRGSSCQLMLKSAHQFIMSDQQLIPRLVVSICLDLLGEVKLNQECATLLRYFPRDQMGQSKIHTQIMEKLDSIILNQNEPLSTIKCPEKFKSLNHLLL